MPTLLAKGLRSRPKSSTIERVASQVNVGVAPPVTQVHLVASTNSVTRMRQYGGMSSPANPTDTPEKSLAEFFAEIESGDGPSLTADDHRALTAAVRSDRERPDA